MARTKLAHALKAAPLKAKKPKQPKSEPRMVEHKTLGVCTLRCIRALDSNDLVAVVEFSDGTERVIRLDERFSRCPRDRMGLECNRDFSPTRDQTDNHSFFGRGVSLTGGKFRTKPTEIFRSPCGSSWQF